MSDTDSHTTSVGSFDTVVSISDMPYQSIGDPVVNPRIKMDSINEVIRNQDSEESDRLEFANKLSQVLRSCSILSILFHIPDRNPKGYANRHYLALFPYGQEDQLAAIRRLPHGDMDADTLCLTALSMAGYEVFCLGFPPGSDLLNRSAQIMLFDPLAKNDRCSIVLGSIARYLRKPLPPEFDRISIEALT